MENDNSVSKKTSRYSIPVITAVVIVLLAAGGYFYYSSAAEPAPDYNKYLNYINEGDSLITKNKFTEAKKSYEQSLKYNPRDTAATKKIVRLDSANQLIKKNNYAEAKKMFQVVVNIKASPSLSQYALSKAGVTNNPPIKISIKWKGNVLEITISGGVPFSSENQPYIIEGVSCTDCITWKKDSSNKSNYIANITGTKIKANRIKMKDKLGQFAYSNVPKREMIPSTEMAAKNNMNPIKPANQTATGKAFAQYVKSGDSLFALAKYTEAKGEYVSALSTQPGDKTVTKKIVACDEKINAQKLAEAKNIASVRIGGGTFTMGTDEGNAEDGPAHQVSIGSFSLSKTEVTVGQYKNFCAATGRSLPPAPSYGWIDDNPMTNITWDEARQYCEWVGGRLPTEAEWEYAAKGGVNTIYSGSNSIDRVAVYKNNSGGKPANVGRKGSNNFNLSDMTGNVSEWCADWYGSNQYAKGDANNPKGPSGGSERVIRGGAYNSDNNSQQDGNQLRTTYRNSEAPSARRPYIGFRVAWNN